MKHIAIFKQPFFDLVLNKQKTIESRWSQNRIAPYGKVKIGDTLLLKETGKNVTATAEVKDVKFYELKPEIADDINLKYGKEICTDKFDNWDTFRNKKYCTLIWLDNVRKIDPIKVKNSNGAGWLVVK